MSNLQFIEERLYGQKPFETTYAFNEEIFHKEEEKKTNIPFRKIIFTLIIATIILVIPLSIKAYETSLIKKINLAKEENNELERKISEVKSEIEYYKDISYLEKDAKKLKLTKKIKKEYS